MERGALCAEVDAISTAGLGGTRVQYAYIEKPKIDQTSLHQPQASAA